MKYTFCYIVGGEDKYYDQLAKSIRSLKKIKEGYKIKILDIGKKISSSEGIEVIHINKDLSNKYLFWQYKYYITSLIDTEYGIYLDCDTIICNDRLEELCDSIDNSFGVVPHFGIKTFNNFYLSFPNLANSKFLEINNILPTDNFYTAGVLLFKNTEASFRILNETFELHNLIFQQTPLMIEGLYDETFLSMILRQYDHKILNGSVNHCSANYMPIIYENGKLKGKNPFDLEYEDIFILHGSSQRQFLGEDFSGKIKEKIIESWSI